MRPVYIMWAIYWFYIYFSYKNTCLCIAYGCNTEYCRFVCLFCSNCTASLCGIVIIIVAACVTFVLLPSVKYDYNVLVVVVMVVSRCLGSECIFVGGTSVEYIVVVYLFWLNIESRVWQRRRINRLNSCFISSYPVSCFLYGQRFFLQIYCHADRHIIHSVAHTLRICSYQRVHIK